MGTTAYQNLVDRLVTERWLVTPAIITAFRKVDRKDFVPQELADDAYVNAPLPIGLGQTISQPLTVAFMLEKLQPRAGDRVLDIGSGSGWQAALLAEIAGPKGFVYAIERIPELCEFGKTNVAKYGFRNVQFFCRDGSEGLPEHAPFDHIIAAASAAGLPAAWKEQLKIGGRIIAPVGQSIWLFESVGENEWREEEFPGFVFVPLIST